jgi:hypothetical protein
VPRGVLRGEAGEHCDSPAAAAAARSFFKNESAVSRGRAHSIPRKNCRSVKQEREKILLQKLLSLKSVITNILC